MCRFSTDNQCPRTVSIQERTALCIRWRYRPTGRSWWGGEFTSLGGQPRDCLGRLHPDGTLDNGLIPGAGLVDDYNPSIYSLVVQADGKILVGGLFTALGGQPRDHIGRLNPDGTLDNGFDPGTIGPVYSVAVQADVKILVGGYFTTLGGQSRGGRHRNRQAPEEEVGIKSVVLSAAEGG